MTKHHKSTAHKHEGSKHEGSKHEGSKCACKPKSGKKRKASPAIKWMGAKVKELRKKYPGKPFGWYGREAGRLYREKRDKK